MSSNEEHQQQQPSQLAIKSSIVTEEMAKGVTSSYRDFSRASDDKQLGASLPTAIASSSKEPTFPVKLHMILSNPEYEDIIAWLPHGRSWRILQQKAFEERVIPHYFRHGRYSSFARQVNGWGFRRITHGSDYNSYYHELFLRGIPNLCDRMRRLTTKDMSKRKKSDEEPSPDFYALSRKHPLPESIPVYLASATAQTTSKQHADSRQHLSSISPLAAASNVLVNSNNNNNNNSNSMSAAAAAAAVGLPRTFSMPSSAAASNPMSSSVSNFPEMELAMLERRRAEILERMGNMTGNGSSALTSMGMGGMGSFSMGSSLKDSLLESMRPTNTTTLNVLAIMQQQHQEQQHRQAVAAMAAQQRQQQQQLFGNGGLNALNPDLAKLFGMNNGSSSSNQGPLLRTNNTANMLGNAFGF